MEISFLFKLNLKDEAINKQGDVLVQIVGDKRRTDVFPLKALCDDDSEAFAKIDYDLGKVKFDLI